MSPQVMKTTIWICGLLAFSLTLAAQTKPLLSETFESGSIDPAIWEQKVTGTVSISVVEDATGHGKRVLKVHYPADTPRIAQGAPDAGRAR